MSASHHKPVKRSFGEVLKDAVLFLAAPFISLLYMMMFPFIGLVMLVRSTRNERGKRA